MKAKKMRTLEQIEADLEVLDDLASDQDFINEVGDRHKICDYILKLQEEYKKRTGEYYTPRRHK